MSVFKSWIEKTFIFVLIPGGQF